MSNKDQALTLPVFTREHEGVGIVYRNPHVELGYPGAWMSVSLVSRYLRVGHEQAHRDQWDALRWVYDQAGGFNPAESWWVDAELAAWCDRARVEVTTDTKIGPGVPVWYGDSKATVVAEVRPAEDYLGEIRQFRIRLDDGEEWEANEHELELVRV